MSLIFLARDNKLAVFYFDTRCQIVVGEKLIDGDVVLAGYGSQRCVGFVHHSFDTIDEPFIKLYLR
jgi:hypothetical protein